VLARQSGAVSAKPGLDSADRAVSEAMMELWPRFARTRTPKGKLIPDRPEYARAADRYLYVSGKSEVRTGFSKVPGAGPRQLRQYQVMILREDWKKGTASARAGMLTTGSPLTID